MKYRYLIIYASLLFSSILVGQNFQDVVKEADEITDLDEVCQSALGFMSTPEEVEDIVNEIVKTAGMQNAERAGFKLKACDQINNALAKILKEKGRDVRYVIYDPNWLIKYSNKTNNDWSATFILAHEIGHHVSGHSLNKGSSEYEYELAADYFAGKALSQMGASTEAIEKALEGVSLSGSATHPGRAERISSALQGWNSVTNKELTIVVKKEDIDEVGLNMMNKVRDLIQSKDLRSKEEIQKTLQILQIAKNKYYKGYTEDIRYYEAILYHLLDEKKSTVKSIIEYLSIENLNNIPRINQLTDIYVKSDQEKIAFFTNEEVLYSLSNAFFEEKQFDNAISFGTQYLSRSDDDKKKSVINKLIAESEIGKVFGEEKELSTEDLIKKGDAHYSNAEYENAFEWYKKASLRDNHNAHNAHYAHYANYKVGELLLNGNGVSKDITKALEYIKKAAAYDQVDAQFKLGQLYAEGTIVQKDLNDALFWLKKARENGNSRAANLIIDIEKSLERKNTNNDVSPVEKKTSSLAQTIAKANTYYDNKMYSEAYPLMLAAAEAGDVESQYKIGLLLYKGNGTSKSKSAAISWWRLAAKQGHIDAINILTRLGEW